MMSLLRKVETTIKLVNQVELVRQARQEVKQVYPTLSLKLQ